MGGLGARSTAGGALETILRRDRWVTLTSLAIVVALAWVYLWVMALEMDAAAVVPAAVVLTPFEPIALSLTFVMWVVMMAGMMVPSAAPAILLYGTLARKRAGSGNILPAAWTFASGYLLVWTIFSLAATLLQAFLDAIALLTPAMVSSSNALNATVLIIAGAYQLTPLKNLCLTNCTNPLEFFITRWRGGPYGAWKMGMIHGVYCVGCCWALMLLLFVAGVMNLLWVAIISAFVLVEKVWPNPWVPRAASVALFGMGIYLLIRG